MLWPYAPLGRSDRGQARIDRWLPVGARKLEHHAVDLSVSPAVARAGLEQVRLNELRTVRWLLLIRGIGSHGSAPLAESFSTAPFLTLDEEVDRERVFGVLGPFWEYRPGHPDPAPARTPEEFRTTLASGRMAAIGNWRADPTEGGCRLWTETWVGTTGAGQTAAFTAYWLAIAVFSAWIRRAMLAQARCSTRAAT